MSDELVSGLKCRLCGKRYGKEALNFCTEDFGPLEVDYNYEAVKLSIARALKGEPSLDTVLAETPAARHPFAGGAEG